jgi:hypothetical protein
MRLLNAFSFAFMLSQLFFKTIPAQASRRFPSSYNRHRPVRQFRAPAIPFRIATHERLATSASRFHSTILSYRPPLKSSSGIKFPLIFVPGLTQLRICGKLIVYAAWFLRAVA